MKRLTLLLLVVTWTSFGLAGSNQSHRQVIPAAASAEGLHDSFWRTDLFLFNPSDREAMVSLELVPSGLEGSMGEVETVDLPDPLPAGQSVKIEDALGVHFSGQATGALVVLSSDGQGAPLAIVVSSRTWTPATGGDGSYGQGIPGVPWDADGELVEPERVLSHLEASESFRTNLGLVNLSRTLQQSFDVEIFDSVGELQATRSYVLGPWAHVQRNNFLDDPGS